VYDMSDSDSSNTDRTGGQPDIGRRRFWQGLFAGGLGSALFATGFSAFGDGGPRHGGFFRMHGRGRPEDMLERAEFTSDWMLTKVGASDAQKEQMRVIVSRTVNGLAPLRKQHRDNRRAILEALAAPTVDPARLAELRRAELQLADQASQMLLDGMTDAANVLTPDQRQQLVARMERHRGGRYEPSRQREPDGGGQPPQRTS
jgi:Spy/CpxP family protein refolding chaperone